MQSDLKIVGLSGKIGTGKTTVALLLVDLLPGWQRTSFGDVLKAQVSERFDIELADCYERKDMLIENNRYRSEKGLPHDMTIREILQWWGTEVMRERNPYYWVGKMEDHLSAVRRAGIPGLIIDDVRFPNEAQLVKNQGTLLARIQPYPGYVADPEAAKHPSETALDGYKGFDVVYEPRFGMDSLRSVAGLIAKRVGI